MRRLQTAFFFFSQTRKKKKKAFVKYLWSHLSLLCCMRPFETIQWRVITLGEIKPELLLSKRLNFKTLVADIQL